MKTTAIVLTSALFCAASAYAASIDSDFTAGIGSWNTAGNWSPSGVPDNGGDTYNVTLSDGSTINELTSDIEVQNLTVGSGAAFNTSIDNRTLTVVDTFTHASGTLTIQGSMALVLEGNSTVAGGIALSNGGTLLNQGALVFGSGSLPSAVTPVVGVAPGAYGFRNEGAVNFSPGTAATLNNAVVQNTGFAEISTGGGGDALMNSYSQSEASGVRTTLVANGSTLHGNTVTITSGNLYGSGTVNGSSLILGTGSDGASVSAGEGAGQVGTLSLTGNLGTVSGATLHFDLGGTTQGTQYDLLNAPQNLNVSGVTFSFAFVDGFTPSNSDTFAVVSALNVSGFFSNESAGKVSMPGVGTFDITTGSNAVVLSNFVAVPEPGAWGAFIGAGLFVIAVARRRQRRV